MLTEPAVEHRHRVVHRPQFAMLVNGRMRREGWVLLLCRSVQIIVPVVGAHAEKDNVAGGSSRDGGERLEKGTIGSLDR